jgi:hypothetical protein
VLPARIFSLARMFQGDIHGNAAFEEKHGGKAREWWSPDDTCGPNPEPAKVDEAQLAEAVIEESKKKRPKKSRYELERYASKIVKMGNDGKEPFYEHLGRRIREAGKFYPNKSCLHALTSPLDRKAETLARFGLQECSFRKSLSNTTISMSRQMLWLAQPASLV